MRRSSYFRRTAGCVEGQTLCPPRLLFAHLPSIAGPAEVAGMPQRNEIQQPILEGEGPSVAPASETTQRDAPRQPVAASKDLPMAAALDTLPQPQPIQTHSPKTLPEPARQREADPSVNPPFSAQRTTRSSQPWQTHAEPSPAAETPIQPRRLAVLEAETGETPKPIEALLQNAAAPEWLSVSRPSDLPGRVGIPTTSGSFPQSSTGARPRVNTVERTAASKQNFQAPEDQPATVPMWVEPPAREKDRNAAGNRAEHAGAAGGTVHIGSLEVKITQLPSPPASQAASPVRRTPAISSKPLSKEFPTFGIY